MKSYTLFYSSQDHTSQQFLAEMQQQQLDFEAVDIDVSMANLKRFLSLRDNRPEFDGVKEWGQVGLPVVVLPNNRLIFDLIDLNGTSCSITPHH